MKQKFTCLEDALIADGVSPYKLRDTSSKAITVNQRFDRLVTVERVFETTVKGKKWDAWVCKCDCGNYKIIRAANLLNGMSRSCGCLLTELGESRRDNSDKTRIRRKLKSVWSTMKYRCLNAKCSRYKDYGGRGIFVCREWINSFDTFYRWALLNGYKDGLSIDRIDNDKGYYPDNCRWADAKTQTNNRSWCYHVEWQGKKWNVIDFSKNIGIKRSSVFVTKYQKKYGFTVERRYKNQNTKKNKGSSVACR